jgi:hypothetical protein
LTLMFTVGIFDTSSTPGRQVRSRDESPRIH